MEAQVISDLHHGLALLFFGKQIFQMFHRIRYRLLDENVRPGSNCLQGLLCMMNRRTANQNNIRFRFQPVFNVRERCGLKMFQNIRQPVRMRIAR